MAQNLAAGTVNRLENLADELTRRVSKGGGLNLQQVTDTVSSRVEVSVGGALPSSDTGDKYECLQRQFAALRAEKCAIEKDFEEYKQLQGDQNVKDPLINRLGRERQEAQTEPQPPQTRKKEPLRHMIQTLQEQLQLAYDGQKTALVASERARREKEKLERENETLKARLSAAIAEKESAEMKVETLRHEVAMLSETAKLEVRARESQVSPRATVHTSSVVKPANLVQTRTDASPSLHGSTRSIIAPPGVSANLLLTRADASLSLLGSARSSNAPLGVSRSVSIIRSADTSPLLASRVASFGIPTVTSEPQRIRSIGDVANANRHSFSPRHVLQQRQQLLEQP